MHVDKLKQVKKTELAAHLISVCNRITENYYLTTN